MFIFDFLKNFYYNIIKEKEKRESFLKRVGGMYKTLGGTGSCPGQAFHQMEKKRKNERSNYWI